MGLNYQKYINRLKQKRQENPEYALYRQSMQAMAEPMKQMNRTMQGQMKLAGGSIGAIGSTYLQGQTSMQNLAMQTFGQADRSAVARNDALDSQIMGLEQQKELEAEQKKNATTKSAITIGATALGALAGSMLLPGAGTAAGAGAGAALAGGGGAAAAGTGAAIAAPVISPVIAALPSAVSSGAAAGMSVTEAAMLGSQIGAGIGGVASSFVGGADYNALQQSIGDTLAGIQSISTLRTHKDFLGAMKDKMQYLNTEDKEMLRLMLVMGDIKGATALLNGVVIPATEEEADAMTGTGTDVNAPVEGEQQGNFVPYRDGGPVGEINTTIKVQSEDNIKVDGGNATVTSAASVGTGKDYKGWQAMVNKGDMSSQTIKMRNIESFKERGYWIDAKGKKKTTKPDDYDKYYGTTAEQTPAVKPKEETNPPVFTEEVAAKATDKELDEVIIQARDGKPESGVFAPTADEIIASVMDSHKTVSKDAFVTARKKAGASPAYDAMFDYMEKNGLAYDSPAMKKWVEGKYKAAGTYDRFKKIYKAAGGQ